MFLADHAFEFYKLAIIFQLLDILQDLRACFSRLLVASNVEDH